MILLDTDHLTALVDQRHSAHAGLVRQLTMANDFQAVPIVCAEEQCKGWLAKIHRTRESHRQVSAYLHLQRLFQFFRGWQIAPFDSAAADLFEELRRRKIRIGAQDLKIAAIALAQDALLLSANLRDFQQVPDLRVENWLA